MWCAFTASIMCRLASSINKNTTELSTATLPGLGSLSGLALLNRSIHSSVDYMLSLQGSRVQGELAHM